jgi:hypothetical protein
VRGAGLDPISEIAVTTTFQRCYGRESPTGAQKERLNIQR